MNDQPIYFTQAGYDKLVSDMASYRTKRESALVKLQSAREQGDLSENGAYKAARFELSDIDRNIRRLATLIKYGKVKQAQHDGTVGFGNTVTLEKDGVEIEYLLVSKHESDPMQKKLSVESPLGQALLGKKKEDTITVTAPAGIQTYHIQKIS